MDWSQQQARYGALNQSRQGGSTQDQIKQKLQQMQPRQAGSRSGVTRYLPAAGAVAGGLLAAPFTGGLSLVGTLAALGGATALGSAAGELGAQTSNKEGFNLGRVGKEAAIGGVLGAIPIGGVAKVAKAGMPAKAATQTAPKGVPGMLTRAGERLESRAAGIGPGEKLGMREQTVQESTGLLKWAKSKGMPSGDPNKVNIWAENYRNNIGKQLESEVKRINAPFKGSTAAADFRKAFNANTALKSNPAAQKVAAQVEAAIAKDVKSNSKLITTRRNFQDNLNYTRGAGKTPQTEQVYQVAVDTLNNNISKIAPRVKSLNNEYSQAAKVLQGSTKQTQRMTRQGENAGAGLVGRLTTGDAAQTAKSKAGSVLQKIAGGSPPPVGPVVGGATRASRMPSVALGSGALTEALKQVGGRGVLGTNPQADPALVEESQFEDPTMSDNEITNQMVENGQLPPEQLENVPQQVESKYSLDQALMDIQKDQQATGGKNIPEILSIYKAVAAAEKTQKPSAAMEKQQLQVGGVQDVYNQISTAFAEAGGGRGRVPGLVGKYAGTAGFDQKAYNYNQFRDSMVAPLARAISGEVGVLTDADIKRADGLLPKITDSQTEAKNRLMKLQNAISQKKQRVSGGGGNSNDLEAVLAQLQGAY